VEGSRRKVEELWSLAIEVVVETEGRKTVFWMLLASEVELDMETQNTVLR
jgi:hypothetical protein